MDQAALGGFDVQLRKTIRDGAEAEWIGDIRERFCVERGCVGLVGVSTKGVLQGSSNVPMPFQQLLIGTGSFLIIAFRCMEWRKYGHVRDQY